MHFRPGGEVFVSTYSRAVDGAWITDGLPSVLPPGSDGPAVGTAVLRALRNSTTGVLPSRNVREDPPDRELLAWLGAPSYAAYARGVAAVHVSWFLRESTDILVTPYDNLGRGRGFVPLSDLAETITEATSEAIGAAVLRAKEHARA
ncbi:hypothetical protein [Microbacterium neimengense]